MKKIISLLLALSMLMSLSVFAFAVPIPEKPYDNSCFFSYKDYTLHYRVYDGDPADKKQIMLVHGFCLSTASLEGVAQEYMSAGYDVITVDAPNFGYSSRETIADLILTTASFTSLEREIFILYLLISSMFSITTSRASAIFLVRSAKPNFFSIS